MSDETVCGKIDVLDKGFVRLVGHYGSDKSVVDAARVSISGVGVNAASNDKALIHYLMRNRHTTPFEMVDFTFHVKCPIFVARQWMRHRTFSYNEMSGRYSELPEDWYVPHVSRIVKQSKTNNQGSDDEMMDDPYYIIDSLESEAESVFKTYRELLEDGMTRELARINLPVATYTEFFVKGNLHNWLHFLSLRLDSHAQYEIRVFAEAIASVIQHFCPVSYNAFLAYRVGTLMLTSYDILALKKEIDGNYAAAEDFPTKRELAEFKVKKEKLGITDMLDFTRSVRKFIKGEE